MRLIIAALLFFLVSLFALDRCSSIAEPPVPADAPVMQYLHKDTALTVRWGDFCIRSPRAVFCAGHRGRVLTLAEVRAVDARLRSAFVYVSDTTLYHRVDYWATRVLKGDCEDYALTVADRLADAGQDGSQMALSFWFPDPDNGHASLLVQTSDAGIYEISVGGDGGPIPFDPDWGVRLGLMPMDGSLTINFLAPRTKAHF